jgi:hypothetical protein
MSASVGRQGLRHGFPAVLVAAGHTWYGRGKSHGWARVKFEESLSDSAILPDRGGRSSRRRKDGTPATTCSGCQS